MYCKKCGKEIDDNAAFCSSCGAKTSGEETQVHASTPVQTSSPVQEIDSPKTAIGVVCGLFLGIIGLIIGICLYKEGTVARQTFIKGWLIAFIVGIVAVVLIYAVVFGIVMGAASGAYGY